MLMAEEAQASYHQQYEMLQRATSHEDIDTADLYAVQQLLRADEEAQEAAGIAPGGEHDHTEGEEEYDEVCSHFIHEKTQSSCGTLTCISDCTLYTIIRHQQGDEEYDEDEEEGEEGATYEELIELGQQIGDVKAER